MAITGPAAQSLTCTNDAPHPILSISFGVRMDYLHLFCSQIAG